MQVKIIEPIREYSKVFNTPDEFNIWYSKNKDEVDALTTHKLNKMYKIEGYRITKIKNILMLKKDNNDSREARRNKFPESSNDEPSQGSDKDKDKNKDNDKDLREEVAKIKDTINQIIAYLNLSKQ